MKRNFLCGRKHPKMHHAFIACVCNKNFNNSLSITLLRAKKGIRTVLFKCSTAAQYGFFSLSLRARVPAIEREKRDWAINFKCYVHCVHKEKNDSHRGSRFSTPEWIFNYFSCNLLNIFFLAFVEDFNVC